MSDKSLTSANQLIAGKTKNKQEINLVGPKKKLFRRYHTLKLSRQTILNFISFKIFNANINHKAIQPFL